VVKANLVVDDDMHRAARTVTTRLGEVEHFLIDALPGHGRIAMDQHRQDLLPAAVATTCLAGIDGPCDHGIDDLKVRRVERQRQVARAARGHDVGRIAKMVFDVTRAEILRLLAFELVEQHGRRLAQRIDQHVQAATVRHADDDIVNAAAAGDVRITSSSDDDQRFAAFERKALLADVARVQVTLERLGGRQALEQAQLLRRPCRFPCCGSARSAPEPSAVR
jgi:hypothetical protein